LQNQLIVRMWFVFPQVRGLGRSPMAEAFAIASREEAEAYLRHPILGPRLRECSRLVTEVEGYDIEPILGHPDCLKFQSSMTLFGQVAADNHVFADALQKYYGGELDQATLERL
jgi:uncharacterized protein (DUF1810 family)